MKDEEIITLFLKRSEEAVLQCKRQYGKLIYGIAYRILLDKCDAEECEQDTYMGAWNTIPPQNPQNLKCYLARIARNQALKKYRMLHAKKRNVEAVVALEELEDFLADRMEESTCESTQLSLCINSFLEGLTPEKRKVFVLRYWYMASVKEIMTECGMGKSKVETMLFRLRNELKGYLEEGGFVR